MKIQFLGHASFLISTENHKILVDPFISANPQAENIDISQLNPDYILLTHAHQDHVLDVETIAQQSGATLISNFEITSYYAPKGIEGHGMNTGGSYTFPFGTVTSTLAHHSSSFADGTYGGNPNGYLINTGKQQIYISGDTSVFYDMRLLPELYGKIDLAIFPIGGNFTMGAKEAALAAEFVDTDRIIGCHYDTFPPIQINKDKARSWFEHYKKELILLEVEETFEL